VSVSAAGRPPAPRPNLLIFHCHDLGQHIGPYGIRTVHTPHLQAFADEGVRFARSFSPSPSCSPSRAALLTGRYPHTNGVMGLCHANFAWDLHPKERHLAQVLKAAGYATSACGVVHETASPPKRCGYERHLPNAYAREAVGNAIGELDRLEAGGKPFFLFVGTIEPHRLPMPASDTWFAGDQGFPGAHLKPDDSLGVQVPGYLKDTPATREELAGLQGAVRHVDEQFGRLLAAVRDKGLEENTLVVFTTDHGIAMPRAKCSLYEPGLEVALLLRWPGRQGWSGGRVVREMVCNVDVMPTLLDALGVPAPPVIQGRSFAPLLDGVPTAPNTAIFGEMTYHDYYDPRRSVRTERWKLIANFTTAPAFMDPSQQWRPRSDVVTPANRATAYHPHLELYDLVADPFEQRDLAADPVHADALAAMCRLLWGHLTATRDPILRGAVTGPHHRRTLERLRAFGA